MIRTLLIGGTALLLIGLLLGFSTSAWPSPEVALDAHVAGVQHGMLLLIIAACWRFADLGTTERACAWFNIFGLWGIWLGFIASALAGDQYPGQSPIIEALLGVMSVALVIGVILLLRGFVRHRSTG